jgi:thiamine biosynthesis lipoprotein
MPRSTPSCCGVVPQSANALRQNAAARAGAVRQNAAPAPPREYGSRVTPLASALALAASAALLQDHAPLDAGGGPPVVSQSRELMGTRITVAVVAPEEAAQPAIEKAFAVFADVDREMSEWRPDSPLSQVNAAAGGARAVAVGPDLCAVLDASLRAAKQTGGLFDPTWAALRGLWRFGDETMTEVPPDAAIDARCKLVSWREVELRRAQAGAGCGVRLRRAGMQLGLGGVAKGFAVDRAVAALRAAGLRDFYVQAGGDLYAGGTRGGRPWAVGIRDPRGAPGEVFARLEVSDAAFSTSGDYERFAVIEGRRYHHLIDPRTCRPATASRSATVLAPTAMEAEFLTKAAFIRGGRDGVALVERRGAQAVLVTADNRVLISKSLEGRLRWRPPTP